MELLGNNLECYFNLCSRTFLTETIVGIGAQIIMRLRHLHELHMIHRDIKPDNFVMGLKNNKNKLYIIDFGLCNKYRSSKTKVHIPFKTNMSLVGTCRYTSINALEGFGNIFIL